MTQSGLIDIHTHVVPRSLPGDPGSKAPWPCMSCSADGKAMLKLGEMPFRELDERSWSVKRRCVDMDRAGVALQLLSPMPELLSYWQSDDDAEYLADHVNAAIGEMVSKEPTRFVGLGMAPFQSPARAVCYVERLRERFGLLGIEIGSNINGALPGDAQFDPIFAAIEVNNLAVFVHALHPITTARIVTQGSFFGPMVGFPLDTAMAGASLIASGVLTRYPALRIALSHGGGAIATILGRLDQGWEKLPELRERLPVRPSQLARQLFYDSNVYDKRLLAFIAEEMAPGQVCVGTDYPYAIMQTDPHQFIECAGLSRTDLASLRSHAAKRFIGI